MKYTAFAMVLMGLLIVGYAALVAGNPASPEIGRAHLEATPASPSVEVVIALVFASFLIAAGIGLWIFGGRGFSISAIRNRLRRKKKPGGEAAATSLSP